VFVLRLVYSESTPLNIPEQRPTSHQILSHRAHILEMSGEQNNISAKPNLLCDTCLGVVDALQVRFRESDKVERSKHENPVIGRYLIHEIQTSGLRGCHFCSIISQALCPAHSEREISQTSGSFITIKSGFASHGSTSLRLDHLAAQLKDSEGNRLHYAMLPITSDVLYSNHPVSASWSLSTGSDATYELAHEWLDHCLSSHELCEEIRVTPISADKSPFPTYLVDVKPGHLRLCHSGDLPDRPQYLTLSHRWGGSHIMQLTTKNLTALSSEINLSDLPKTFQDAISITRRLGYRFLWIDSLCIIQDSREHWETESAIMGDIYRGSTCTIAALGATNGDSGCFKARNPLCFQLCRFELGEDRVVYLRPKDRVVSLHYTGHGPQVEPLHERAWVMQEWMLSPRTLHYGTFGLYWECIVETANDRMPRMSTTQPSPKHAIHQACTLTVTGKFDADYKAFWRWWARVISMYNPCDLTKGTDKLVAIAGIVKLVENRTGLRNLAGLWREHIYPELLWYVDQPTKRPTGAYQAPTWSWASLNSQVSAGIQDFDYEFDWKVELLEAVVDPVAANGQLSYAHIRIRGLLQLVRWEVAENGYKLRWGEKVAKPNSADDRAYFLPDVPPDPEREVWALLVVHATGNTAWMNMGLLVAKQDMGGDVWVRVGSFRQYDRPTDTTEFFQGSGVEMRELVIV
jgi:hypothetical protein